MDSLTDHFLISKCIIRTDIHGSRQNTCEARALAVGKTKWKPLKSTSLLLYFNKAVKKKNPILFGSNEMAEINATLNDLKNSGVVVHIISPFNFYKKQMHTRGHQVTMQPGLCIRNYFLSVSSSQKFGQAEK